VLAQSFLQRGKIGENYEGNILCFRFYFMADHCVSSVNFLGRRVALFHFRAYSYGALLFNVMHVMLNIKYFRRFLAISIEENAFFCYNTID
jgi:hypothetical protein